jgi:hypothetical protein
MNFHSRILSDLSLQFPRKTLDYASGDKLCDIATKPRDLLHDPRAEISILLFRHEEDSFDGRFQLAIHQRHLEFELEIRDGAQPAHDSLCVLLDGEFDQQSIERQYLYAFEGRGYLAQKSEALPESKIRLLLIVMCDRHNHFVKKLSRPLDDIEVTVRDRVEAARINRASHGRKIAEDR